MKYNEMYLVTQKYNSDMTCRTAQQCDTFYLLLTTNQLKNSFKQTSINNT